MQITGHPRSNRCFDSGVQYSCMYVVYQYYMYTKRDFVLTLGFALQRANSRMLRGADKRRRKARGSGLYSSGTRPFSSSSDDDY